MFTLQLNTLGQTIMQSHPESGQQTWSYSYQPTGIVAVRTKTQGESDRPFPSQRTQLFYYDQLGPYHGYNLFIR